jgi:hypothetical protein
MTTFAVTLTKEGKFVYARVEAEILSEAIKKALKDNKGAKLWYACAAWTGTSANQ